MGLIKAITWRETARGHQTLDMTYRSNVLAKDQYNYTQTKPDRLNISVAPQATETTHSRPSTAAKEKKRRRRKGCEMKWKKTNNQLNKSRGMNKRRLSLDANECWEKCFFTILKIWWWFFGAHPQSILSIRWNNAMNNAEQRCWETIAVD